MQRLAVRLSLCIVLAISGSYAQTPTGTIQGIVLDGTHAAVPDAKIVIINERTNETKELRTDATGHYILPFLLSGSYAVTAEKTGFRTVRQDGIKLDVGQNRSVDLVLELGSTSQSIEVPANTVALDENTSSVGQLVDNKRITDLPLNGRYTFSLANLAVGVNPTGTTPGSVASPGLGGGRNASNEIQIDGMTDIAPDFNVGVSDRVYEPPVDSVEEFTVQINGLAAEYGRFGGGVMNVATKSGTNQVHGTAYEFLRNSKMNATDFFANRAGIGKGAGKSNQFGASMGAPVYIPHLFNGRNKTFFFTDFEGTRNRSQIVYTGTVPQPAWRTGDLSNLRTTSGAPITIFDPLTAVADPAHPGAFLRTAFPGNIIPANRMDPVALNAIKYYPLPNTRPSNVNTGLGDYVNDETDASEVNRGDVRLDENWNDRFRTFVRTSVSRQDGTRPNQYGNLATPSGYGTAGGGAAQVSLDNTYTISPTLFVNVRYGLSRYVSYTTPFSKGMNLTTLGLPQSYGDVTARNAEVFPAMSFNGTLDSLGQASSSFLRDASMTHALTGSLTKITSRHTIKAGGEFRKMLLNYTQYGNPSGSYAFNAAWTQQETTILNTTQGFPLASFLLGLPASGTMTHQPAVASSNAYWAGYVQDDWKVTDKLTFNIGVRYDLQLPRTERYNAMSVFNMNAASPIAGQAPADPDCPACTNLKGAMSFTNSNNRTQVPANPDDFAPRVGFAYRIGRKTVMRGGYGISYVPSPTQAAGFSGGMEGYNSNSTFYGTFDGMGTIAATLHNPFPNGFNLPTGNSLGAATDLGTSSIILVDSTRSPYVQQWNFNLQRQLPGHMLAEVSYIGNHGVFLVDGDGGRTYDQLPPSYLAYGSSLGRIVPNPFYGIITDPTSALSKPTVSWSQLQRPYPQYTGVGSGRTPTADSIYHAMTARVDKRLSRGLSFLASYTMGKAIDDASNAVNYLGPVSYSRLDSYNRRLERALSSLDISQRLVVSGSYELPVGKGKQLFASAPHVVNTLISGWQGNVIATFQHGTPLFITVPQNNTGIYTSSQRANNNGHSAHLSGGSESQRIAQWFNTSVFSQPQNFTFGDTGRNLPDVRGPGQHNVDLSIFKNTRFGPDGRLNLQFRVEMFNALNTPQFAAPGVTLGAANFGAITADAVSPRQIQMALKLIW